MDDPEKIYRQRRREARSRKPELVDPKVEADSPSLGEVAPPLDLLVELLEVKTMNR